MIHSLDIENLILIEKSLSHFDRGFNALTGETGAGKTAFIEALHLALGKKADSSLVRKGRAKAVVEATFEIDGLKDLHNALTQLGIAFQTDEHLIIRREIPASGKSKSYVNTQLVNAHALQKISSHLVEVIGQHAHTQLFQTDSARSMIDAYSRDSSLLAHYQERFMQWQKDQKEFNQLTSELTSKAREEEILAFQIEEIQSAAFEEGEEESLTEEYKKLQMRLSAKEKISHALIALDEGEGSITHKLGSVIHSLKSEEGLFETLSTPLQNAMESLQEASFSLNRQLADEESDPMRLVEMEERLSQINHLLKKYGPTHAHLISFYNAAQEKLSRYQDIEERLEELERLIDLQLKELESLAEKLTAHRKETSDLLTRALKEELQELGMPHVRLEAKFEKSPLSPSGQDEITYLFSANPGIDLFPLQQIASGGELARFFLALKILLSDKESIPILFFDEIDANIGGTTATLVGEKLKMLAKRRQLFCITHFAQVARQADHHLTVQKFEEAGHSYAQIRALTAQEKEIELDRMVGKDLPLYR